MLFIVFCLLLGDLTRRFN